VCSASVVAFGFLAATLDNAAPARPGSLEAPHVPTNTALLVPATIPRPSWPRRQYAACSQCLLELVTLVLKNNRCRTFVDVQDERGIDRDVNWWRRRLVKTPEELNSRQDVVRG
jgi:hypothetical protein